MFPKIAQFVIYVFIYFARYQPLHIITILYLHIMKKTIAITSMYANPIHPGHIECLRLSRELADELWVIVNNDRQAEKKRGITSFQNETFRAEVV